jgi:hypothetical protein
MRLADVECRINVLTKLSFDFMERDVVIVGGEILKWSVNKRGEIDGEYRQLFNSNTDVRRIVSVSEFI